MIPGSEVKRDKCYVLHNNQWETGNAAALGTLVSIGGLGNWENNYYTSTYRNL